MILELATIDIKPGTSAEFEKNLALAQFVLEKAPGYISHEFHRCIEINDRYILLIKWVDMQSHVVGFRESDLFKQWRGYIGPFFQNPPVVVHFDLLFSGNNG